MIPKELSSLIPKFDGDEKLLNLFIVKCEYIINRYRENGNADQDLYVFHTVTSRVTGRAAALLSERQDILTWSELKRVFTQHFGDPRSEECIAIELETLRINNAESYLDFCSRIQQVKSTLLAKVNLISDVNLRASKITIYDNMAMNVFLFNLPEDLLRIVRLKGCTSLETALSIVLEEVNFQFQYNSRNKMTKPNTSKLHTQNTLPNNPFMDRFGLKQIQPNNATHTSNIFRNIKPFSNHQPPNFKFGVPPNVHGFRPNLPQQQFKFGLNNQQFKFATPNQQQVRYSNPNPQFRYTQPAQQFKFGLPLQQGYRPPFNNQSAQQLFNKPPQGPQNFGNRPQRFDTDVSMRTAVPAPRVNALCYEGEPVDYHEDYENHYDVNDLENMESTECNFMYPELQDDIPVEPEIENFHIAASEINLK